MKFTLSWLKEFLDTDASLEQIVGKLNTIGLEVDSVEDKAAIYQDFKIAKIIHAEKHPEADKLKLCQVDDGENKLQIVCGAANARTGIKVVLAPVGTLIPANNLRIKASKIRGVDSNGMLCSREELGLSGNSDGIMEIEDHIEVGASFAEMFGLNDPVISVEITPNRGDCLGVYGIARDLAAAGLGKLKPLDFTDIKTKSISNFKVTIEDQKNCPVFAARVFENVQNCESPEWLKKYLSAIGSKSISCLVDITNYISLSFGRPLHVYDQDKLVGGLTIRAAKSDEKIKGLDDIEYVLNDSMLVIADDKAPQCLAGVLGGMDSGCNMDCKNIVLESAWFDPVSVANTGRALKINSESRYRFERKVDPNFVMKGAILASQLINKYCGGTAYKFEVAGSEPKEKREILFPLERLKTLGGFELPKTEVVKILENLGFEVEDKQTQLALKVPTWRMDVEGVADIVEEVLRIHGLDELEAVPLPGIESLIFKPLTEQQQRKSFAKRNLANLGYKEVVSWSFMSSKYFGEFSNSKPIRILNPISSDLDVMRPSLVPNLLSAIETNLKRSFKNLAFFEVANQYISIEETGFVPAASFVRTGEYLERNPHDGGRNVDIFDVKADVLALISELGFNADSLKMDSTDLDYYHPYRKAALKLGNKVVAVFGEIHPKVLRAYDIKPKVFAAEIYLNEIPLSRKKGTSKPKLVVSDYQAVDRDFAFLVPDALLASQIEQEVKAIDKNLIKQVSIFDAFKGKNVPEGKKSLAFSVKIQAMDHTLTEEELNDLSKRIIFAVEKFGGELRS